MSTLAECIADAIAAGRLNDATADSLRQQEEFFVNTGVENPAKAAIDDAIVTIGRKKRLVSLQVVKQAQNSTNILAHPKGALKGLQALLARDDTLNARYSNVDQRRLAVMRDFTLRMAEAMDALRLTHLGWKQDQALSRNVVRELFGESSGDARAAKFAAQVSEAMEQARVRFNAAGGDIAKREDWGMPQSHDSRRVRRASREEWKDTIRPLLNREKMLDANGKPMTDMEFELALDDAYQTIASDGLNRVMPGATGGTMLANRHRDHRFFVFHNAEAWLEYQGKFGSPDPYFTIMNHLENMAGEISLMEILGPNPAHAYRTLKTIADKTGAQGFGLTGGIWNMVSGQGRDFGAIPLKVADRLEATRNVLTSAKLGSAMLSALSDLAFFNQTAHWNGLSSTRAIKTFLQTLNPANKADRLRAVQMGLTADAWSSLALHANRFSEVTGAGFSARMADITMRLSGLSAWTDAGQKAIGLEFLARYAELADRTLGELPPTNRELLERAGFTAKDWDILRSVRQDEWKGVKQLWLPAVREIEGIPGADLQRVQNLTQEAIAELTNAAIPAPDARARAITSMGLQKGTIGGEISRLVFQFKSFPVAVILSHVQRGLNQSTLIGKGAYLAELTIGTTVMGALSLQLKQIARGKDPANMEDPKFWVSAFIQGGGAGIYGDFVYAGLFGTNRFGQSLWSTVLGPGAGLVEDVLDLTAGNVGQEIEGRRSSVERDALMMASQYTPIIGSLWYTRLGYERQVLDQLALATDTGARRRFRQREARARKERGQRYWWPHGQTSPERFPGKNQ